MSEKETFKEDAFCKKCGRVTEHTYVMDGHERDSSYDSRTCDRCGEVTLGMEKDY